jgi:CheY-like chemotaxis protein
VIALPSAKSSTSWWTTLFSHFAFEEELMEEAGYTFTNAHKRVHEIFIKRVAEYRQRYQAGEDIADELKNMLSRWLINHIRGDDKAYAETIKRNQARPRTTSSATRMAPAFLRPSPFRQRRLKNPSAGNRGRRPRAHAALKSYLDRPIEGDESCAMRMWRPQNAHDSPSHARIGSPAPACWWWRTRAPSRRCWPRRSKAGWSPVTVVSTLAEAQAALDADDAWFLVLTGLVLADGDRDAVVDFFLSRGLPTVVVSGVYDEDLRKRVLRQQIIDYVLKNAPGSIDYLVWLVQRLERNRRISALVVDDALSARAYAAGLLEMYGYRVVQAADGPQAIARLEADPSIRLALLDQEMPGMGGVELTRKLRAIRARDRLAIIGISGTTDPGLVPAS